MKKNKLMRLASVLLVMTLLSTSVIGGTFAKYITSDSAKDTARVAKFGVVATVTGDLFADSYDGTNHTAQAYGEHKASVSAGTQGAAVVAPGTKSDPAKPLTFGFKGTPEVSIAASFGRSLKADGSDAELYSATVELATGDYGVMVPYAGTVTSDTIGNYYTLDTAATGQTFSKITANTDPATVTTGIYELHDAASVAANYLPIVWTYAASGTVNGAAITAVTANTTRSLKTAFDAISGALGGQTALPNNANDVSATLGWYWNFEDQDVGDTDADAKPATSIYSTADPMDTILGDMIAASATGVINSNQVVVMKSGDNYLRVNTATVPVITASDAANTVTVAYTGTTAPDTAYTGDILGDGEMSANVCAVLGVAFNASLTVAQVD